MRKSKIVFKDFIPYYFIFTVYAFMLLRGFAGFDWSDESYYASLAYRLVQGDALFATIWDSHQLAACITYPLISLFVFFNGSADGLILFLRIAFITAQLCVAVFAYNVFKGYMHKYAAALISVLFFLSGTCIRSFSYNTQGYMFWALSALLLIQSRTAARYRLLLLLSDFFAAIAIQSYPSTVFLWLLFLGYTVAGYRTDKKRTVENPVCFIAGNAAALLAFIILLSVNSSFEYMVQNFKFMLSDPEHTGITPFNDIKDFFIEWIKSKKVIAGLIASNTVAVISSFTANARIKKITLIIAVSLIIVTLSMWIYYLLYPDGFTVKINNYLLSSVSLFFSAVYFLSGKKKNPFIFLYAVGIFFSVCVVFTSNSDASFTYPLFLSSTATFGYAFSILERGKSTAVKSVLIPVSVLIITAALACNIYCVYRDDKLPLLKTRINNGPAEGIFTSYAESQKYEALLKDIDDFIPQNSKVIYLRLMPFGYLYNNVTCAAPSMWRMPLGDTRFEQYYEINPGKMPDCIFVLNDDFDYQFKKFSPKTDKDFSDYMEAYIRSHEHTVTEVSSGTIYIFN